MGHSAQSARPVRLSNRSIGCADLDRFHTLDFLGEGIFGGLVLEPTVPGCAAGYSAEKLRAIDEIRIEDLQDIPGK